MGLKEAKDFKVGDYITIRASGIDIQWFMDPSVITKVDDTGINFTRTSDNKYTRLTYSEIKKYNNIIERYVQPECDQYEDWEF